MAIPMHLLAPGPSGRAACGRQGPAWMGTRAASLVTCERCRRSKLMAFALQAEVVSTAGASNA